MHVAIKLSKFYDWVPVPKGTVVTEEDIAAGKVMPDRFGGYRMKVVKTPPSPVPRSCTISEGALCEKIIEEKSDIRKNGRTLTRFQAVAALIADQLLRDVAEWDWITGFDVHDDGPSEELLRAKLDPHTKMAHGRRPGRMNVPAEHVDDHIEAYLSEWGADRQKNHEDLVAHLKQHFAVR